MINASVVLYKHQSAEIQRLVQLLKSSGVVGEVFLIDNSPEKNFAFEQLECTYIFNGRNSGYGAAHNIAIRKTLTVDVPFHLVVNPDIQFSPEILPEIHLFMQQNAEIGMLMPQVLYPDGSIQHLCKLIPTPADLLFRRFLPEKWTQRRMAIFEMHDSGYSRIMNVPYLSGCFMFLRTSALREVGLFDERFFMYPEDIDLTRRMYRKYRTVFYPQVSVIHAHTRGSYRFGKLFFIHIFNLIKYFNKWGWFCDRERTEINHKIICD